MVHPEDITQDLEEILLESGWRVRRLGNYLLVDVDEEGGTQAFTILISELT